MQAVFHHDFISKKNAFNKNKKPNKAKTF